MSNQFEDKARAIKVAKLVSGATFCNDLLCQDDIAWPDDEAEGLRMLVGLLTDCGEPGCGCHERLWSLVTIAAGVTNEPSAETRAAVVAELRAAVERFDRAADDDAAGRALLASM
jgi:hypothetical protein